MSLDPERQRIAREYARTRRIVYFASAAYSGALVVAAVVAIALGWRPPGSGLDYPLDVAAVFIGAFVAFQLLTFPIDVVTGHILPRRYGLSVQTLKGWFADWAKALVIGFVIGLAAVVFVYGLMRVSPDWWWIFAGIAALLFTVVLANLAPVLLLPLFFRLHPFEDEALAARLERLAERAGTRVRGVFTMDMSAKSTGANAALMGWGNTRRIVLSDTLIQGYTPDEIEVILAHELGHHVHRDIPKLISVQSFATLLGFLVVHLVLRNVGPALGVDWVGSPLGMPLLALVFGIYAFVTMPALNAISRIAERAADWYALESARLVEAFVSAMDKLTDQNLAESTPPRWAELLFASHPSHSRRVAMAGAYERKVAHYGTNAAHSR